jgi:hypothetical protein
VIRTREQFCYSNSMHTVNSEEHLIVTL